MQPVVELREVRPGDAEALAAAMRDQDVAELHAAGHTDLLHVVKDSVAGSTWARTVVVDGELAAIVGFRDVSTMLVSTCQPWMLGTELVPRHKRALARLAPRYIAAMLELYEVLQNVVHARNTVAVGWLRHVGFTIHPPTSHPLTGEPFCLFNRTRHV